MLRIGHTGKHCLHLALSHLTVSEYLSKKCDRRTRLNEAVESIFRRLLFISFQVCGNLCNGNNDVNFVLARFRFARLVLICLVGLKGGVKYSSFLKLSGPVLS